MKFTLTFLLIAMFGSAHTVHAASWGGGTGNWVSDNWGLDAPDGSPGDAFYTGDGATITSGGVIDINPSDSIALGSVAFVTSGIINQSGGIASFDLRLDMRTQYNLTGGTLTDDGSTSWRVNGGGAYNISGGIWSSSSALLYQGDGSLNVSGGDITLGQLLMDDGTHTGSTILRTIGTDAGALVATTMRLQPNAGGSAEAQFAFSNSGIDSWRILGGGSSFSISDGVNSADLFIDMTTYATAGTEGFILFDYSTAAGALNGTFGNVSVNSDHFGVLALGASAGSLAPGEYFLEYADGVIGDGTDVVLFANNTIPEPSTLALMGMSLLALSAYRRLR